MRQIVLDTETTGLTRGPKPFLNHKLIEIGAVELIDGKLTGNNYHVMINPQQKIDDGAVKVHGITNERLKDEPIFIDVYQSFLDYAKGSDEIIIHNAPFDVGFLNNELADVTSVKMEDLGTIVDTLKMARSKYPGKKNNLDALCVRFNIDLSKRTLHGALLDAELLADVYLAMTRKEDSLFEMLNIQKEETTVTDINLKSFNDLPVSFKKYSAPEADNLLNKEYMEKITK